MSENNNVNPIPIESQKDMLFSKLLPAINNNPFSTTYAESHPEHKIPAPAPEVSPADVEISAENDPLENLRSRLFARQNTEIQENYVTINIMENAVLKSIDSVIQKFNSCSCDRCKCDIAAQALNNLSAKYIVTNPKNVPEVDEVIDNKAVTAALVTAVIKIKTNPRH